VVHALGPPSLLSGASRALQCNTVVLCFRLLVYRSVVKDRIRDVRCWYALFFSLK